MAVVPHTVVCGERGATAILVFPFIFPTAVFHSTLLRPLSLRPKVLTLTNVINLCQNGGKHNSWINSGIEGSVR